MTGDRDWSSLRESFCPEDVKILFIGESPPAGGKFFYAANSNLFRYTNAAFTNVYGARAGTGEDLLRFFMQEGCYLVDLCEEPVNQLLLPARRAAHHAAEGGLADRIRSFQPCAVVVVSRGIRESVARALEGAGLGGVKRSELPFPAMSHQDRYVRLLASALLEIGAG